MRLDFWTSFLSFFLNLSFSYLDDFVVDVGKRVGSFVGKSIENLIDFDGNWVDEFEQHIDVETVVLAAPRLTARKFEMIPPSWVVCLRVRIVIRSGIGCIHVFKKHLLSLIN